MFSTSTTHLPRFTKIPSPAELKKQLPLGASRAEAVERARHEVAAVLDGSDDRLLVVVGPCSVHDPHATLDYASRLTDAAAAHSDALLIVMRVYLEKPRSMGGWKGLINDPHLDGSHDVAAGLHIARRLLLDVLEMGLSIGCEFLEPTSAQFFADTVAWGAIGARTTESQTHRQLASGLPMPVGFKNATDGDVQIAADGCLVARQGHVVFGMDEHGAAALVTTAGNPSTHVVLRGGRRGPNYAESDVEAAAAVLVGAGISSRLIVDASHANSGKDHERQVVVARELAAQIAQSDRIAGVMLESFIESGRQDLVLGEMRYGQSITDSCMGWETTEQLLTHLADASRRRIESRNRVDEAGPAMNPSESMANSQNTIHVAEVRGGHSSPSEQPGRREQLLSHAGRPVA